MITRFLCKLGFHTADWEPNLGNKAPRLGEGIMYTRTCVHCKCFEWRIE